MRDRWSHEQHVLAGVVLHLAGRADVVVSGGDVQLVGSQDRRGLVPSPGEVVAVVSSPTSASWLAAYPPAGSEAISRTQRTIPRATSAYSSVPNSA